MLYAAVTYALCATELTKKLCNVKKKSDSLANRHFFTQSHRGNVLKCHSRHKTCLSVLFQKDKCYVLNVMQVWTWTCQLFLLETVKNGDNPPLLYLAPPSWNTGHNSLLLWKRQQNEFQTPFSPSIGTPFIHATSSLCTNMGSNASPHNTLSSRRSFKLWLCVLPFDS